MVFFSDIPYLVPALRHTLRIPYYPFDVSPLVRFSALIPSQGIIHLLPSGLVQSFMVL